VRLLLTGAAGFIGQHCIEYFTGRGDTVVATDVRPAGPVRPLDISDPGAVEAVFREARPDAVLHMAAIASVPQCEADPTACWSTNLQGTIHVARAATAVRARVVFFSTAAVYGVPRQLPTPVSALPAPTNLYGVSKAAGEVAVRGFAPEHVLLRLFNIYGEGCLRSYVIPDLIRKLRATSGAVDLQGTGQESRDFLYISDLLRLIEGALRAPAGSVFNAGSGTTITIRELAQRVARVAGRPETAFRFEGPRVGDFPINYADISAGNVPPGWHPEVSLDEGIRRMLAEAESAR
jgi:UDP-glucose 4-epimerase